MVAIRFIILGAFWRQRAYWSAANLFCLVIMKWKRAMIAPSNSAPCSVRIVTGEKLFHRIISQMLVAMKSEIPDPSP